jgi:hypothetical protein
MYTLPKLAVIACDTLCTAVFRILSLTITAAAAALIVAPPQCVHASAGFRL